MKDNITLPFSLTLDSLDIWLDKLVGIPPAGAANHLSQILKLLDDSNAEVSVLYPLLINLTSPVMYLSQSLAALSLSETLQPYPQKSVKIAKLGIQLLKQLAMAFCKLAETGKLENQQQQIAAFYALQLIGFCLRNYALLHEIPSPSLWKKSAALYKTAFNSQQLEQKISCKVNEFKPQKSLAEVIKRNLLFHLLSPSRYRTTEIDSLFQLSNQYFEKLSVAHATTGEFNFYWNLEGDEPCAVRSHDRCLPKNLISIDCREFNQLLHSGMLKTALSPPTLTKIGLCLTDYQAVFNSILFGVSSRCRLSVGLIDICAYLHEQDKLAKRHALSLHSAGETTSFQHMALMPLEHEIQPSPASQTGLAGRPPGQMVSLLHTTGKSFTIAENCGPECTTGSLVMIYKDHQLPGLAIIRRKHRHDVTGASLVLLENIGNDYGVYTFTNEKGLLNYVLVIGENTEHPEAYLPCGKYSLDISITLNSGKTLNLMAYREHSQDFYRFRVNINTVSEL